jgi:hypothetical protein
VLENGVAMIGANGNGGLQVYATAQTDLAPHDEDVVMQLDLIGSTITFRAWRPGEIMPPDPLISHTVHENPSGGVALFMGSDAPLSDAVYRYIQVAAFPIPAVSGDFNRSASFDSEDINLVSEMVRRGEFDSSYDLNLDSVLDQLDRSIWVHDHAITWFGDADVNGEFNSSDMVQVFAAGKYENGEDAGWSEGDWDGNGLFDSSDMVTAFVDGGYEKGPRTDAVPVPEPGACMLFVLGALTILGMRRWGS